MRVPFARLRTSCRDALGSTAAAAALVVALGAPAAFAQPASEAPPAVAVPPAPAAAPTPTATSAAPAAATAAPASATPAAAASAASTDLGAIVSEIRSSVTQITALRKSALQSGDKVKESCLYDRLRSLSQTLDSAQAANVGYEAAAARGEAAAARSEQARGKKALELAHKLRSDAENCVGNELRSGPRATTVTVTSTGASDDPLAGPSEMWTVRPARLELPSRPNPASAFHPPR